MKILSAAQLHEWDAYTILEQDISSDMLMERAAIAFTNSLLPHLGFNEKIGIVCGPGNNGGDGLCIARLLHRKGFHVHVVLYGANTSTDNQLNYHRAVKAGVRIFLGENDIIPEQIQSSSLIIDALFGSGLTRPLSAINASVVEQLNALHARKFSVDIPSGMMADIPSSGVVFRADHTFSFETPKLAFFFPENASVLGDWKILPIGLSESFLQKAETPFHIIDHNTISSLLHQRDTFSHKGSNGHALIIAGSASTPGAAALCSFAALEAGAGLVTLCSDIDYPEDPEVMITQRKNASRKIADAKINVIALGPGMGTDEEALAICKLVLQSAKQILVLDADALNILASNKELINMLPAGSILTPHPGEYARLFGAFQQWDELIIQLQQIAKSTGCILLYKRAFTIVVLPDGNIWFNSTGNAGMATAGSGDVLTGMITALLAQGYNAEDAALLGVYLHGLSGDIAMQYHHGQNLAAGDILDHIQDAYAFMM